MSTTPINEAGITATFAAIFAALDSLLDRVATLESARIAAPVAPESAETGPGVPMEPGTQCGTCKGTGRFLDWGDMGAPKPCPECAEVAAALRMYRKVQSCTVDEGDVWVPELNGWHDHADAFLAWLKEGEAQ